VKFVASFRVSANKKFRGRHGKGLSKEDVWTVDELLERVPFSLAQCDWEHKFATWHAYGSKSRSVEQLNAVLDTDDPWYVVTIDLAETGIMAQQADAFTLRIHHLYIELLACLCF
jgi:hypothetical protein